MTDRTPKISADDYKALFAKPEKKKRGNKYNAQSTVVDGEHFPSQGEAAMYCVLKMDKEQYKNIYRYPSVKFPGGVTWKIDAGSDEFRPVVGGGLWHPCYHEYKGIETADYRVKLKLYEEFGSVVWFSAAMGIEWGKLAPTAMPYWTLGCLSAFVACFGEFTFCSNKKGEKNENETHARICPSNLNRDGMRQGNRLRR